MKKRSIASFTTAVAGLALSVTAGAGIASADPELDPFVNTTCSYEQVMSAIGAQNPIAAAVFNSSPQQQAGLHQFLGSPPDERLRLAQQIRNEPANQPYFGLIQQAFSTCNSF